MCIYIVTLRRPINYMFKIAGTVSQLILQWLKLFTMAPASLSQWGLTVPWIISAQNSYTFNHLTKVLTTTDSEPGLNLV